MLNMIYGIIKNPKTILIYFVLMIAFEVCKRMAHIILHILAIFMNSVVIFERDETHNRPNFSSCTERA